MLKKIAVVGSIVAVAGLGAGGIASAWSGAPAAQAAAPTTTAGPATSSSPSSTAPTTTSGTSTTSTTTKKHGQHDGKKHNGKKRDSLAKRLSHASHAQWVTENGKTGAFVTHDAVRGTVTAAAAGSVTVKATDGTSETYVITGSTKVRVEKKPATAAQVKVGDRVAVVGTGRTTRTATRIVDRGTAG